MSRNVKVIVGFLVLVVIALVGLLAYDLGTKSSNPAQNPISVQNSPTPTAYSNPNSSPSSSPVVANKQIVTAGGVLIFPTYTLQLPEGWTYEREQGQDSDKLTLTKLGYKITIYEAAFGGGGCTYPGDAPQEMAQTFTSFVEITDSNGFVFRRGMSGPNTWTVCQKNTTDGSFGAPTIFGHISFVTPGTPDKNAIVFPEADSIFASLKKI